MLSFRTFISAGALALAALVLPSTASAAIVSPWVHVQGVGFTDQNGLPVVLRGVNQQGGAGVASNGMALSLGSNFVRILAPWSTVEDTAPVGGLHTWNEEYLQRLDAQVTWYEDHGVNVLIDFHQYKWSPYFGSGETGVPGWFYNDVRPGLYPKTDDGIKEAMSDWWTDAVGRADYLAFVRMMVSRYGSHANVVGYEVFNEPMVGNLGENHASTQAVISWEAPIVNTIRLKDPERAVFFMLRGGGDNGLVNADFTKFGPMTNLVLDLHDYYNGLYGSGYTPDQESWVPSWDATHNQNFLDYHGTEDALVQNLAVAINKTRRLGIPLVVGEWGAQTADSGVLAFQHHLLSVMSRYGLSWARWNLGQGADPFTLLTPTKSFNLVGADLAVALATPAPTMGIAPAADIAPKVTGFAQVGQVLTASNGTWAGVPAPVVTDQWQRCNAIGTACKVITGSTAATYVVMPSDLGSTLRVAVRARSSAGHTVVRTAVTAPVTPNVLSIANLAAQVSPIAPTVTVSFDLNKAAAIRIVIRDAAGAVVKKLDNADHPAGPVLKRWGEILDGGLPAPHGGYTALITATTATEFTSASIPFTI
jgi:Cellulase (glycosyl hydrolase family 5)/FlgD Ig-like domain